MVQAVSCIRPIFGDFQGQYQCTRCHSTEYVSALTEGQLKCYGNDKYWIYYTNKINKGFNGGASCILSYFRFCL
jgi:hypothetical protein